MAWTVIQEGGASIELYLSVWDTLEEAEAFRQDCTRDGAYRTTDPMELPDNTDWVAVESLLQSIATLDFVEVEDERDELGATDQDYREIHVGPDAS